MLPKRDNLLWTFSFIDVLYHTSCCTSHRKIIRISLCKHQVTSKPDSWLYLNPSVYLIWEYLIQVFDNCSLFIFLSKRNLYRFRKQLYLCCVSTDLALKKSHLEILIPPKYCSYTRSIKLEGLYLWVTNIHEKEQWN